MLNLFLLIDHNLFLLHKTFYGTHMQLSSFIQKMLCP